VQNAARINCFNYSAYVNTGNPSEQQCNNAWLFFSFLVMFGSIIAATWIMVRIDSPVCPRDSASREWRHR
jgi:hypothetical protein